jgi:hypothetical protein
MSSDWKNVQEATGVSAGHGWRGRGRPPHRSTSRGIGSTIDDRVTKHDLPELEVTSLRQCLQRLVVRQDVRHADP